MQTQNRACQVLTVQAKEWSGVGYVVAVRKTQIGERQVVAV